MKNTLITIALFLATGIAAWAQAPQQFNYQGVARSAAGAPLAGQPIGIQIIVHDGSPTGTVVYQETQTATTNSFGLYNLSIGGGSVVSGTFSSIPWATGNKYMEVDMDATGGSSFTPMGTTQLLSVPYAQYANSAALPAVGTAGTYGSGTQVPVITTDAQGRVTVVTNTPITVLPTAAAGSLLYYNGTGWTQLPAGTEGQVLTMHSGLPAWVKFPSLFTTGITALDITTATSGGNINNNTGGLTITAKGVCWSTSPGPTVSGSHTTDGTGSLSFSSNITGLTANTVYYLRGYAICSADTAYGNEISFTTMPAIGAAYGGGKLAYILQPGDPGYNPVMPHGLIAAPSDQSAGYCWDCGSGHFAASGSIAIGAGYVNTCNIMDETGGVGNIAFWCWTLTLGGYTDWYLPSINELKILYLNRTAIGGFSSTYYWSSSECNSSAYGVTFIGGYQFTDVKAGVHNARAVRAF